MARQQSRIAALIASFFGLGLLAVPLQVTWAATIVVNTPADDMTAGDGQCTLREAVANVNAAAEMTGGDCLAGTDAGDTIIFSLVPPATIGLSLGELAVHQNA